MGNMHTHTHRCARSHTAPEQKIKEADKYKAKYTVNLLSIRLVLILSSCVYILFNEQVTHTLGTFK